jgi:DNA-binding PadR family transcriptional regulator
MCEARVSKTARVILDYLRENPDAQDTLSGIVQWWLPEDRFKPRTAAIKEALDELVSAGLIIEHEGKDAQISYRMTDHALRELGSECERKPC